jgi:nucleoside 2-deoxyribosyltransferase
MQKIYLAGLISTDFPESLTWRTVAEFVLSEHVTVLSPMRGKANLASKSTNGGLTDPDLTPGDIILRDYNDIRSADIVLVNLETFGSPRPILGTCFELGWAYERRIPVIAVAAEDNSLMREHPFMRAVVTHYFQTLDEALSHVLTYYDSKGQAAGVSRLQN